MDRVVVDAIGARIEIDVAESAPVDRETIARVWQDAIAAPEAVGGPDARVELGTAPESSAVLAGLSTRVTVAALGARRGDAWMLHACGVADEDGRVAVLVGPSGAGKTTAAAALGTRFGYVSDESIGIDAGGRVFPYRKPLSVVRPGRLSKEQIAPSVLGLKPLPATPLRVSAVILLDRRRDDSAARWEPELSRVPDGFALAALAEQSSYLTSMPTPLRTMRSHLQRVGGAHTLRYDDATHLPDVVATLFARAHEEPAAQDPTRDPRGLMAEVEDLVREGASGDTMYAQAPHVDAVEVEDGRVAVLRAAVDGAAQLIVLAPHAAAVWSALAAPAAVDEVTVRRVAEELVELGLLRRTISSR